MYPNEQFEGENCFYTISCGLRLSPWSNCSNGQKSGRVHKIRVQTVRVLKGKGTFGDSTTSAVTVAASAKGVVVEAFSEVVAGFERVDGERFD